MNLDVRSSKGADYNSDHYLVAENVREKLALSKQAAQKFDGERFNLRKLNELEVGNNIRLRSQTGLRLLRTYVIARTWIGLGRTLKRI